MDSLYSGNGAAKCSCECCCRKTDPRSSSAKASSFWNTRNDSSNVSSLLAPDLQQIEEVSEPSSTNKTNKTDKTNRTLVSKSNPRRSVKSALLPPHPPPNDHCESCYCRDSPNLPVYDTKATNFRQYDEVIGDTQRMVITKNYGRYGNTASHGVKRIPKEGDYTREAKIDEKDEKRESVVVDEKQLTTYQDFKELAQFRKDNYFETHSSATNVATTSSSSIQPDEHRCVHKFVINDRFLPQPLNCDSFGVSRCDLCNKPMESFKSRRPPPRPRKKKDKEVNRIKKMYEYNLTPPRLNIGRGDETVQIKVPERLGRECLSAPSDGFKLNRTGPKDSYALRYQRGRL